MPPAAAAGVLLIVVGLLIAAAGALWSYAKAVGGEWDLCPGSDCINGWYFALPLLLLGLAAIGMGIRMIGRSRRSSGG